MTAPSIAGRFSGLPPAVASGPWRRSPARASRRSGSSPPAAREIELRDFLALLESVEDGARQAVRRGMPAAEAAREWSLPEALGDWVRFSDDYYEVAFRAWERELRS